MIIKFNLIDKFKSFNFEKLLFLSKNGHVPPFTNPEHRLLAGTKPIWMTDQTEAKNFIIHYKDFTAHKIKSWLKEPQYAVYHKEREVELFRLIVALQMHASTKFLSHFTSHIALGEVFGYSVNDISKWLTQCYNENTFNNWLNDNNDYVSYTLKRKLYLKRLLN